MKRLVMAMVALAVVTLGTVDVRGADGSAVDLAQMAGWDIVTSVDPQPGEQYAAEEFQTLFKKASGVKLPIVQRIDRIGRHVFIGAGKAMRSSAVGFATTDMGTEESRIVVRGDHIAIAGSQARGTLYGVYRFLEDYMGVRFLTHDHTHVPKVRAVMKVGPLDSSYEPPFGLYRICGYPMAYKYPAFGARMRYNAHPYDEHLELGGRSSHYVINHSFYRQVPLEDYAEEHPEYFGVWGGRRVNDAFHTSLCFTNTDLPAIITKALIAEMDNPTNLWKRNFSVSQMDTVWQYCQCDKCAAIDAAEDSHMGALLHMVNAVAAEVEKTHPEHYIGTLSYGFSRKPPKNMMPRDNVQINFAPIEGCQLHSFDDPTCPSNAALLADLKGWSAKKSHLLMWIYGVNFNDFLLPYPNLYVFKKNFQIAHELGVKGVFVQCGTDATETLEFSDLRTYVMCRLLNNPSLDTDVLIDEFVNLHYGAAAPHIRQFIDMVHQHYADAGVHQASCVSPKTGAAANWNYPVDAGVADKGLKLFDAALQAAEDGAIKKRVRQASVCAYRAAIDPLWRLEEGAQVDDAMTARMKPLCETFFALCDEYGLSKQTDAKRAVIAGLLSPETVSKKDQP